MLWQRACEGIKFELEENEVESLNKNGKGEIMKGE